MHAHHQEGRTLLHWVAYFDRPRLIRPLLERGANVEAYGNGGRTPLHYACAKGHMNSARELCISGANPTLKDNLVRECTQAYPTFHLLVQGMSALDYAKGEIGGSFAKELEVRSTALILRSIKFYIHMTQSSKVLFNSSVVEPKWTWFEEPQSYWTTTSPIASIHARRNFLRESHSLRSLVKSSLFVAFDPTAAWQQFPPSMALVIAQPLITRRKSEGYLANALLTAHAMSLSRISVPWLNVLRSACVVSSLVLIVLTQHLLQLRCFIILNFSAERLCSSTMLCISEV